MKHYRMASEGSDHFVMRDVRDNKHFKVAKSGLSEPDMARVRKLADGGDVGGTTGDADDPYAPGYRTAFSPPVPEKQPSGSDLAALLNADYKPKSSAPAAASPKPDASLPDGDLDELAAKLPRSDNAQAEAPDKKSPVDNPNTAAPSGIQTTSAQSGEQPSDSASALRGISDENNKIVENQVKALQAAGAASERASQQQAKIYDDQAQKMQALQEQTQQRYAALDKEQEQLKQDVANTTIDPTRVWSSASTGGKIMAGIGVLLSGIGSGLTGGPNMAMQVINKTIDDDIAAQKANLGKKETLLSTNYRKYGDLQAATAATALQLNSVAQGQIAAAAARAQGPQAQAAAGAAIAQMQMQAQQMKQQLAMQGLKNDVIAGGSGGISGPSAALVENLGLTPRAVNTPYGIKIAQTPEDAKDIKSSLSSLQTIDKRLDDMLAFAKQKGTTAPFGLTPNSATGISLKEQVIQELGNLDSLKRLTGEEVKLRQNQVPDPGALNTSKAVAQIMTLKKFVQEKTQAEYANHLSTFNPGKSVVRDVPVPGATLTSGTR